MQAASCRCDSPNRSALLRRGSSSRFSAKTVMRSSAALQFPLRCKRIWPPPLKVAAEGCAMNVHVASHSRAYRRDLAIRFIIAVIGFAPITALAAAIFGFGSLWSAVMILVLPGAAMLAELL